MYWDDTNMFYDKKRLSSPPMKMKSKCLMGIMIAALVFFLGFLGGGKTALCEVIHIGISPQTIPNANINDAMAAIKAWTQRSAKMLGIQASFEVEIIDSPSQLRDGLEKQHFEVVNTSIDTILPMISSYENLCDTVFVPRPKGEFPVRYVLVVHRNSGITNPGEIKNGILTVPPGDFMQLADIWLKIYFQQHVQTAVTPMLPNVTRSEGAFKAGMQVFFRQIDATVMRRDELNQMGYLNPQIKNDLRIIGASAPLIPVVLILRSSWQTPVRHAMETLLSDLHTTTLGKQMLRVFHCSRLEKHPISILESTLSFLQAIEDQTYNSGGNKK